MRGNHSRATVSNRRSFMTQDWSDTTERSDNTSDAGASWGGGSSADESTFGSTSDAIGESAGAGTDTESEGASRAVAAASRSSSSRSGSSSRSKKSGSSRKKS